MAAYRVVHTTRYEFEEEAASCTLEARMRARDMAGQTCRFHQLVVRPLSGKRRTFADAFGNPVTSFEVPARHQSLEVSAINLVETAPRALPEAETTPPWEAARSTAGDTGAEDLAVYLRGTELTAATPGLADYAQASFPPGRPILAALHELTHRIHTDFAYAPGATTVATTAAEAARLGKGVCQDFAHLAIAGLRALGLPARYVSGYLDTMAVRGPETAPGREVSHAWFAAHVPGLGWLDFDPTNDRVANGGYVTLAWGRDYEDAAPLRGAAAGGGRHRFRVSVELTREDNPAQAGSLVQA